MRRMNSITLREEIPADGLEQRMSKLYDADAAMQIVEEFAAQNDLTIGDNSLPDVTLTSDQGRYDIKVDTYIRFLDPHSNRGIVIEVKYSGRGTGEREVPIVARETEMAQQLYEMLASRAVRRPVKQSRHNARSGNSAV